MDRAESSPSANVRETRRLLVAWLLALVVLFGGTALWIQFTHAPKAEYVWGAIPTLISPLPGKYAIFATLVPGSPLGPWHMALLATLTDIATALTLAIGLGWAVRFRWIERSLKRVHDSAQRVLDQFPRIRRMAFFGVVLFVFLPLPASGSIGGTFVGQFLGLSRSAGVVAVTLGGLLVSSAFALIASFVGAEGEKMVDNPWVVGVSAVVFVLFAAWAWRYARAQLQRR